MVWEALRSTELYLVYDDACKILQSKGVEVSRSLVGNYCTSLEMQGASITLLKCDEEILKNWDAPVHTASYALGNVKLYLPKLKNIVYYLVKKLLMKNISKSYKFYFRLY